jgi:hypothetical protein
MAFPRRFKKEIWYLRLPSGEVELATADALQRSFECGLVDHRTPVRAFGAHTWITMQEAAELAVPPSPSMASLSPTACDPPAIDLDAGARWQSRGDIDPKAFKPSRIPAVVALMLSGAFLGFALLRADPPLSPAMQALQQPPAIAPLPKFSRPPIVEEQHVARKPMPERWTREERHRFAELEYLSRLNAPKSSRPSRPVLKPMPDDPFRNAQAQPRHGDPLDGSI